MLGSEEDSLKSHGSVGGSHSQATWIRDKGFQGGAPPPQSGWTQVLGTHRRKKIITPAPGTKLQGPGLCLFSWPAMPIPEHVSEEVSTSWVHRPQLPPYPQGLC